MCFLIPWFFRCKLFIFCVKAALLAKRATACDKVEISGNFDTHDGEKHVSFSNVQQFFKGDPLSAMGSLPSLGETGMAPVLGTPDLGSFSVPDSSKPGSAPAHKDPNVQVVTSTDGCRNNVVNGLVTKLMSGNCPTRVPSLAQTMRSLQNMVAVVCAQFSSQNLPQNLHPNVQQRLMHRARRRSTPNKSPCVIA